MSIASPTRQLVVFEVRGEEYALPIEHVREIVRPPRPRAVAGTAGSVLGIVSLRGALVPVHDAGARLGLGPVAPEGAKLVVVEGDAGPVGLLVDAVTGVLTVADDQLRAVPDGGPVELVRVVQADDRLIGLLDLEGAAA